VAGPGICPIFVPPSPKNAPEWRELHLAGVAKLADASGLGPGVERRAGSIPVTRTIAELKGKRSLSVPGSIGEFGDR
jgi:hypothetical protein